MNHKKKITTWVMPTWEDAEDEEGEGLDGSGSGSGSGKQGKRLYEGVDLEEGFSRPMLKLLQWRSLVVMLASLAFPPRKTLPLPLLA